MKSKQLANVLIKILGLSVIVQSIPAIIRGLVNAIHAGMRAREVGMPPDYWFYPASSVVLAAIGIYLMLKSRDVAECLFKGEDE